MIRRPPPGLKGGWLVTDTSLPGQFGAHVTPLKDLRPHTLSLTCWCRPTPDDDEPGVVVHHAGDRRESYETGESKPN